jgi:hypothetical protein
VAAEAVTPKAIRFIGYAMMAFGLWAFVWGVIHFNDPPLPAYRVVSLQYGRTFGGLIAIWAGWMVTRFKPLA